MDAAPQPLAVMLQETARTVSESVQRATKGDVGKKKTAAGCATKRAIADSVPPSGKRLREADDVRSTTVAHTATS